MPAIDRSCPACDDPGGRSLGVDDGYVWVRCHRCGTWRMAADVSDEDLQAFYDGYYEGEPLPIPEFVARRLGEVVDGFAPWRRTGRLLDVGFGEATLLRAASSRGWRCVGTELSSSALDRARDQGWELVEGSLVTSELEPASFDVICMVEVLEHLREPATEVAAAARLLRPGGLLYATTPHARGASARIRSLSWSVAAAPEHLQLFTARGLRLLLSDRGIAVDRVVTEGLDVSILDPRTWRRGSGIAAPAGTARVEAGYALNAGATAGWRRLAKRSMNAALRAGRLGDTLKVWAVRP